ncbi:MAG: ROK family transcriptional regulator [Acidobacteriota bacterium]
MVLKKSMAKTVKPARRGKAAQTELSILKLIQSSPSISRVELAQASGLSTAAITGVVSSLVQKNILIEGPSLAGGLGRKRVGLMLRQTLGYVVGVDLGTFNLRVTISDLNGVSLASHETPTQMDRGRDQVLRHTCRLIRETLREAGIKPGQVLGIGVAFSGVIDVEKGIILSYPRPGHVESWRNIPLRKIFEDEFHVPCLLEDSVRAIAISERTNGAGRKYSDFVYIDVGVGIGSAIFIHGKIYRGFNGSAGEFGHMTVDEDGPLCCCGNHGCLEAIASGATLIDMVKGALKKGVPSKLLEIAGGSDKITLEAIAEAAEANDSLAFRSLTEVAGHIGTACADLINLLNPEAIIFGGAMFRAAPELLIRQVQQLVRRRAMEKSVNDAVLLTATTKSDAGAHGIAKLIAERVLDEVMERNLI